MNVALEVLTQPFLHKTITESSLDEIRAITRSYPYFAPAQLALLKKLKEEGDPEYEQQLQKAVLYYYDPIQFEAFIHSDKFLTDFDFDTETDTPSTEASPETVEEPLIEESGLSSVTIEEPVADIAPDPNITPELSTDAHIPADAHMAIEPVAPLPEEEKGDEQLAFEPYHTVDYFASQGIKLSQEEATTDRVGKQLKSFTEWLKTMKRLPAATASTAMDPASEHKVQHLAEHSLENTDIVTEAMAEVWTKQGNLGKAIAIYHKLSLQNPSKKAYFAAKIDQLKKAP